MWSKKKKPVDDLTTIGAFYEVTILENVDSLGIQTTSIIRGELRGWDYDEDRGYTSSIIWEIGQSCAELYYTGDILAVKPIEKPSNEPKFFEPYKGRKVERGMKIDFYRNLHTNNGYSIRCAKTGLVLAHCSTVRIKNAQFVVSESGRQKTIQERRKRVHAYVRGELVSYNEELPENFGKVLYNPYHTEFFMDEETGTPIHYADEVFCSGKYAYAEKKVCMGNDCLTLEDEFNLFSDTGENEHER